MHPAKCMDCSEPLQTAESGVPCPKCGSIRKSLLISFEDVIPTPKEQIRGKVKDPSARSKDKLRKDFISGDDQHRKSGKWYHKDRVVDRDNDSYMERVTDPETGQVIHHQEEPLSQHTGHGSAKGVGKDKAK